MVGGWLAAAPPVQWGVIDFTRDALDLTARTTMAWHVRVTPSGVVMMNFNVPNYVLETQSFYFMGRLP